MWTLLLALSADARADAPDLDALHAEIVVAADAIEARYRSALAGRDGTAEECLAPYVAWSARVRKAGDRAFRADSRDDVRASRRLSSLRDEARRLLALSGPTCVPWDGEDRDTFLVDGALGDVHVSGFESPLPPGVGYARVGSDLSCTFANCFPGGSP